jgi:hypothetical protein
VSVGCNGSGVSGHLTALPASCACNPSPVLLPTDGETQVPRNTRVWVSDPEAVFTDSNLLPVSMTTTVISLNGTPSSLRVFTPDIALPVGMTYYITGVRYRTSFTVGAAALGTPPPIPHPKLAGGTSVAQDLCQSPAYYGSFLTTLTGTLLAVDVNGTSTLDFASMSGSLADLISPAVLSPQTLNVGHGNCVNNWPAATAGSTLSVRFGALDEAGNFSGWGTPISVSL